MQAKLFKMIAGGILIWLCSSTSLFANCCGGLAFFESSCPSPACIEPGPQYGCDCDDLGMYENYCMSREKYCTAFGNIGAR